MIANQLRHKIIILKNSKIIDEYGTQTETFTEYYTTKASIKYNNGGERLENDRIQINQTLTFTIRNRKDKAIEEDYRIRYNNTEYDIKEIIPTFDGVFKTLTIKAEKVIK